MTRLNARSSRARHPWAGAHPLLTVRYVRVTNDVAVWRDDSQADRPLRLRFADLDSSTQAAVLGLNPVLDREEYAALGGLLHLQKDGEPLISDIAQLAVPTSRGLGRWTCGHATSACWTGASGTHSSPRSSRSCETPRPGARWSTWGRSARQRSYSSSPRPSCRRCGGRGTLESPAWSSSTRRTTSARRIPRRGRSALHGHGRADRRGRAQVRAVPADLDATPAQVHENVVSQCDNLLLMRMNSEADLTDLGRLFSFVPPGSRRRRNVVRMGQALVAGRVLPHAAYVQVGRRISEEGGADVPAAWAAPRPS